MSPEVFPSPTTSSLFATVWCAKIMVLEVSLKVEVLHLAHTLLLSDDKHASIWRWG